MVHPSSRVLILSSMRAPPPYAQVEIGLVAKAPGDFLGKGAWCTWKCARGVEPGMRGPFTHPYHGFPRLTFARVARREP